MKREDIVEGMTVRIGPMPSTTTTPYDHNNPSPDAGYVAEDAAGKVGTVAVDHDLDGCDEDYTDVIVTFQDDDGDEADQYIHPAHLEPYTAEAAPATAPITFDDIVGGSELDDLRELGDQLDTLAGPAATPTEPEHRPNPVTPDDAFQITDDYGDSLEAIFRSQECSAHGLEAAVILRTDGGAEVVIQGSDMVRMARWFVTRAEKAQKLRQAYDRKRQGDQ